MAAWCRASGRCLLENTVYDAEGQLLTGSFMDYAMPRAHHTCDIGFVSHPVPATTNPLGTKGCGEAGCAGALASLMNAIVDALSVYGIRHIDMPMSPERVWKAIQASAEVASVMIIVSHSQRSFFRWRVLHHGVGPAAGRQRHRLRVLYPAALAAGRAARHRAPDLRSCICRHRARSGRDRAHAAAGRIWPAGRHLHRRRDLAGPPLRRRAQMTKWADTLAAVDKQFGVDRAIIVAIWGMETSYGAAPGDKDIIRSLVTLAASGYREEFCRDGTSATRCTILQEGHIAREQA